MYAENFLKQRRNKQISSRWAQGIDYCDQMFSLEASWAELPSDERLRKGKARSTPLMMEFFDWCRNQSVLP